MNVIERSETCPERERRQWFVALAFGVDSADIDLPEPPAAPTTSDVLP